MNNHYSITLFIMKTMSCGTDNIMYNISSCMLNLRNIMQNSVSPTKHCYGYEQCYENTILSHNIYYRNLSKYETLI